jgi:hypothetical protein
MESPQALEASTGDEELRGPVSNQSYEMPTVSHKESHSQHYNNDAMMGIAVA